MRYDEPIIGYRYWLVASDDLSLKSSMDYLGATWPTYKKYEAQCNPFAADFTHAFGGHPHAFKETPAADCSCGIHAFTSLEHMISYISNVKRGHNLFKAFGQVSLWGKIQKCEDIVRAEFAYPYGFYKVENPLPRSILGRGFDIRKIANNYAVEILTPSESLLEALRVNEERLLKAIKRNQNKPRRYAPELKVVNG